MYIATVNDDNKYWLSIWGNTIPLKDRNEIPKEGVREKWTKEERERETDWGKKGSDHSTSTEQKKRGRKGRGGRKQYLFLAIAGVPQGEGSEVSWVKQGGTCSARLQQFKHTDTQSHDQTINIMTDQTFTQPYKRKQQVQTTHTPRVQPGNARGYERQRNEKKQEREAVSSCWMYSSGHST